MPTNVSQRLNDAVAAVCPILGVAILDLAAHATRIDFDPSATVQQQTAANNAVASFDWSAGAQSVYDAQQQAKQLGIATGVRLLADVSNNTTNLANCTGLSFPLAANTSYGFWFDGAYTSVGATTGIQIAVNGPAMSFLGVNLQVAESATSYRSLVAGAYDTPVLGVNSGGATPLPFSITGNVTTTAAGNLIVRFRSETNGNAVTIKRGTQGLLIAVQ